MAGENMINIAVFASGRGSNFGAIAQAVRRKALKVNLALLVCDNPQAPVLAKAKKAKVEVALVKRQDFASKADFEAKIIAHLKDNNIDLVVMAGYMRMLSPGFVSAYKGRIINIHPSLLPAFKGESGIKDAFDYGVEVTGVTVHFVDEEMDHGPIILQKEVAVTQKDTLTSLEAKIHKIEHRIYPEAIRLFAQGKLKIEGRKVSRGK
jgi:phosphoribosylglycinamide formyltransferase-1